MTNNPYQAPQSEAVEVRAGPNESPGRGRRCLRQSLLILVLPAVYNFYCFDAALAAHAGELLAPRGAFRLANISGMFLMVAAIWVFGFVGLKWVTKLLFMMFGRRSKLDDWYRELDNALHRMPWFALAGAGLWIVWTVGFYQLHVGFYEISTPVGMVAHLLAAGLYGPLLYRWVCVARGAANGTAANG